MVPKSEQAEYVVALKVPSLRMDVVFVEEHGHASADGEDLQVTRGSGCENHDSLRCLGDLVCAQAQVSRISPFSGTGASIRRLSRLTSMVESERLTVTLLLLSVFAHVAAIDKPRLEVVPNADVLAF